MATAKRKRQCPECGSTDVVEIIYGYPGPELRDREIKGEVALGGCCVEPGNPALHCNACEHRW